MYVGVCTCMCGNMCICVCVSPNRPEGYLSPTVPGILRHATMGGAVNGQTVRVTATKQNHVMKDVEVVHDGFVSYQVIVFVWGREREG